ncbi:MAG: VWA domain-containing protein [Halieaceae bacterium]
MAKTPRLRSSTGDIDKFLTRSKTLAQRAASGARLLFAIDATASRQPTWDRACQLQGQMFLATQHLGGLAVQLCYYRGLNELRASQWLVDEHALLQQMSSVRCLGGYTQIERVMNHALGEHQQDPVKAVVFIGDACEENPDKLIGKAGQLGIAGLPLFMFQEGRDPAVQSVFQQMASLSGGAWARFDQASAAQLAELLGAVARYAAAGREGLLEDGADASDSVKLLLQQLK